MNPLPLVSAVIGVENLYLKGALVVFLRRFFLILGLFYIAAGSVLAAEVSVPLAMDFEADARAVLSSKAVILLYFSAPDCGYCLKLEEAVLKPMLKSGDYDAQVLLRKINWRSSAMVTDFSGQPVSLHLLAERYAVKVTPTLVFVGTSGREIAPRILGFLSADFFWFYLDQRIAQSQLEILNKP